MQIIRQRAFARAGLAGNPSDGYHGKTISLSVRNLFAEVILYEWDDLELLWSDEDHNRFRSIHDLVRDVKLHGYYGGIRLIKATIKKFAEFCTRTGLPLHDRNFSIRYQTTIPRQVGLAGSSAIIVATLRCLLEFYQLTIPQHLLPSLALSVETEELGIAAGLQDRVIQVYEGLVYMDFSRETMREEAGLRFGQYVRLDPTLLPPLYVAYKADISEPTEVFHNQIRARYDAGEPAVVSAMATFARIAADARDAILTRDHERLAQLINANFDTRLSIYRLPADQIALVERARGVGASAKFAGSGGAIIGSYRDEAMFAAVQLELGAIGCVVLRPMV